MFLVVIQKLIVKFFNLSFIKNFCNSQMRLGILFFFFFLLWELFLNNLCGIADIPILLLVHMGGVSHLCVPASRLAGFGTQPTRREEWDDGGSHLV